MLDKLKNQLEQLENYTKDKYLLAVSGGMDSVVLSHLFSFLKLDFGIAHVNFKLRGESSEMDSKFVENLAFKFGVKFFKIEFDTSKYAAKNKLSTQMAARKLRYDWFTQLINTNNYNYIVTAHHQNDLTETILYNLIRGTGIKGLQGFKFKNGSVIRPLIHCSSKEIETYAQNKKINYRQDLSNFDIKYKRNYIRHKLLPLINELNPSFSSSINDFQTKMITYHNLSEAYFKNNLRNWFDTEKNEINFNALKLTVEPELNLFLLLKEYGFNMVHCKNIINNNNSTETKQFSAGLTTIYIKDSKGKIINKETQAWQHGFLDFSTPIMDTENFQLNLNKITSIGTLDYSNKQIAYFDTSKIRFPITVRKWESKDIFQPMGMSGKHVYVKKLFTDQKVATYKKGILPILEDANSNILWIAGTRQSEVGKITSKTETAISIRYCPKRNAL